MELIAPIYSGFDMGVNSVPIYHVAYGAFNGFISKPTFDEMYKRVGKLTGL